MRGTWDSAQSANALRYYVSRQALATVRTAWKTIEKSYHALGVRPWVEMIALNDLLKQPGEHQG